MTHDKRLISLHKATTRLSTKVARLHKLREEVANAEKRLLAITVCRMDAYTHLAARRRSQPAHGQIETEPAKRRH
ncbi:MAG TPA: hypothetical protein VNZ94_04235 [Xanthobacteraceae bacterium]|nr:hypothetical protein [Xanthobacteraceae bacterium]